MSATNTFNPAGPYPNLQHAQKVLAGWLEHWDKYGFGMLAISELSEPQQVIGFGGISVVSFEGEAINNLGYRFATQAWGKGYATEFSISLVAVAFEKLGLSELSARVRENHLPSQNVLIKSGLKLTGKINDVAGAPASLLFTLSQRDWSAVAPDLRT
ncbi:GNAT family N-acetyltransferase [Rouxiella sp. Mn2063]|uniref:GNAT family N-acetyltransferase n=1 Tax=Rouxiella sp. Mn2063 TaxID=3395262 RepID=UPI003BC31FDF